MTPNVLIVIADDQRFDFLRYMPNVMNRIAAPGRRFTNCRCNVGLCQPSRVGLLTGQYATRHQVLRNTPESLTDVNFDHSNTLGQWVQDATYQTALIGKYLNGATGPKNPDGTYPGIHPTGWNTWRQLIDNGTADVPDDFGYRINADGTVVTPTKYQMDYLVSESIGFIDRVSEPWFLLLASSSPHLPFSCRPEDVFAYSDVRWPLVIEDDTSDKPSWVSTLPPLTSGSLDQLEAIARSQLREIKDLDRGVGVILDHLQDNGQLANTLIIYVSDNGYEYGEHNVFSGKNTPYDVALRVPLVMCGPNVTAGVSDEPVCMGIDVTATVLAVTGGQAPVNFPQDGVDLHDVINNPQTYASRQLLHQKASEAQDPYKASPAGYGITTPTRKLWHFDLSPLPDPKPNGSTFPDTDRYEAYQLADEPDLNLTGDPNELESWANDSSRSGDLNALKTALDALITAHGGVPLQN